MESQDSRESSACLRLADPRPHGLTLMRNCQNDYEQEHEHEYE